MTGDDEPVAAVVPAAAADHGRVGPPAAFGPDEFRDISPGVLHQHDARHAVLLERPAVEVADLRSRQGGHLKVKVMPGVRTWSVPPSAAARSPFLPAEAFAFRASITST